MSDLAMALAYLAAGIGAGIVTIGAGLGIGKIEAGEKDFTWESSHPHPILFQDQG